MGEGMRIPELLAPVGDMERLETAVLYGADAVYLGGVDLSLRRGRGFDWVQLAIALNLAHGKGVKVYYCINALPQQKHMPLVEENLHRLAAYPAGDGPDGLIIADPGVLSLARKIAPHIPIHLSTQANTSNVASLGFWREQGVSRVNLARECDLRAVRALSNAFDDLETEMFVHGAMCMAISGRCLMSAYLNQRSANFGQCTHPCRYDYKTHGMLLEERTRPGAPLWELEQGEEYSEILAADDLCLIGFLPWFGRVGVDSLKIEGRMRSAGSLAQMVGVYRRALDGLKHGRFPKQAYLDELANAGTRALSTGLFLPGGPRVLREKLAEKQKAPILGRVVQQEPRGLDASDCWRVAVRAKWSKGDRVQVLTPKGEHVVLEPGEYALEDHKGAFVETSHSGLDVILHTQCNVLQPGVFLRKAF